MATITDERLHELEMAERTLLALEAGGVDNWNGYDFSLEAIRKEDAHNEMLEGMLEEIGAYFSEALYEPSERGAGWAINDHGFRDALKYLKKNFKIERAAS